MEHERAMLKQQWEDEDQREKEKHRMNLEVNKARNQEIIQHNELTEQLRRAKEQEERS